MAIKKVVGRRGQAAHDHSGAASGGDAIDANTVTASTGTITNGTVTNLSSKDASVTADVSAFYTFLHNWQYETDTDFDNEGRYSSGADAGAAMVADVRTMTDTARRLYISHDGSSGSFEFGGHCGLIPISRDVMGDFYVRFRDVSWTNIVRGHFGLFENQTPTNNLGNSNNAAYFDRQARGRVLVGGNQYGSSLDFTNLSDCRIEFNAGDTEFFNEGVSSAHIAQEPNWPLYLGFQLYDAGSNTTTGDELSVMNVEFGKL